MSKKFKHRCPKNQRTPVDGILVETASHKLGNYEYMDVMGRIREGEYYFRLIMREFRNSLITRISK